MYIYGENIYKELFNNIKGNNDNLYIKNSFIMLIATIKYIIDYIFKEIKDKSININTNIIKFIINFIFLNSDSNYLNLKIISKSLGLMIKKLYLLFISIIYKDILIIIYIICIIAILIKKFICINISKDLNKIRLRKNIITNINYIALFMIKFLIIINYYNQINSGDIILKYSKISLKIKGIGNNNILSNDIIIQANKFKGIAHLKEVYINGVKQNTIKYSYYFDKNYNFVELFWDDNLNNCENMFFMCTEIVEINLSNFNTSQVNNMKSMFQYCASLTSINLSNLDTSQVSNMNCMFAYCSSLTSLDLSCLDISNTINSDSMLLECNSLEYINLYNVDKTELGKYKNILNNAPTNIVICLNENVNNEYFESIAKTKCYVRYCSKDWKSKQKRIINSNNECVDSCDINDGLYEYNGRCVESCPNYYLYDENRILVNICSCELDKCWTCPKVALKNKLCTQCHKDKNYYPKENDPLNLGEYINCYNQLEEGYYLDIEHGLYKQCFYTCKTCKKKGDKSNHYCNDCKETYPFKIDNNNYYNCYENCDYYYYFDNENNFHCTMDYSCPEDYPILKDNKTECTKYNLEYEINQIKISGENEIVHYNNILKIIENNFTSANYKTSKIDNGDINIIKTEKMTITLSTYYNQRNNINNNMTKIDLGECEELLRNFYNISNNESLYMKKIDIIQDGMNTLKVEFDVYAKLFGNQLINLNLTVCGKSKILIFTPFILNDNIDKYNSSSGYYNDICYITTSEYGTDIILKDRKNEFINKNRSICQEDCDFSNYDYETSVAKCSCDVKECAEEFADMKIDKNR